MKRKMTPRQKNEAKWGLIFVAPTIIGLLILNYYPIFETVYQSFCKTGDFGIGNKFIGLKNYITLFHDKEVFQTLFNAVKYAAVSLPLTIIISLVLAVLLNRKMKGRGIYRTIFFLPMVCAPAATAMVWKWIFNQQYGLLNHILGIDVAWVTNPAGYSQGLLRGGGY